MNTGLYLTFHTSQGKGSAELHGRTWVVGDKPIISGRYYFTDRRNIITWCNAETLWPVAVSVYPTDATQPIAGRRPAPHLSHNIKPMLYSTTKESKRLSTKHNAHHHKVTSAAATCKLREIHGISLSLSPSLPLSRFVGKSSAATTCAEPFLTVFGTITSMDLPRQAGNSTSRSLQVKLVLDSHPR